MQALLGHTSESWWVRHAHDFETALAEGSNSLLRPASWSGSSSASSP
jgi:hypothetical protein